MQMDADLKKLERRAYLTFFQDGLWDICLGLFLVGWGLMLTLEFTGIIGGIWVALYFIILSLKRWVTYPRTGYIKVAGARRQQMKLVILGVVLLLFGLAGFLAFAAGNRPDWVSEYFLFMFGTMIAVVISLLGYWWKVLRWYIYAGLLFLAVSLYQWAGVPENLAFIVPGSIIALYGLVLLIGFLRKYPKAKEEPDVGA
jgi:hypothetical protein